MKNIFLILLTTLFVACGTADTSDEILSEPEMVAILSDIHVLEAKLAKLTINSDSLRKVYNAFEKGVFEIHGVEKSTYEKSYEYYIANPQILERIYSVVVDSLNVREQQAVLAAEARKNKKKNTKSIRSKKEVKSDSLKVTKNNLKPLLKKVETGNTADN